MPYVITTSEPFDAAVHVHRPAFTRVAVATLEEARERAFVSVTDALMENPFDIDGLVPESGGTVGPLPDGTVIEVERVSMPDVLERCGQNAYLELTGGRIALAPPEAA